MVILFSVPSHGRHQMGANSGLQWDMYTKAAVRATSATSLPMWGVEGSGGMVP
jgi:hypothetical protein